jgi:hypothetical protein
MSAVRRAIVSLFGLVVAIAAALIVLPVAAVVDPVTREAGAAFAHFALFALADSSLDGSSAFAAAELARFLWTVLVAVCVIPLVLTVLIGAVAGVHSLLWYAGATGCVAALSPWVARAAFHSAKAVSASPVELRFAAVFFATGAAAGLVFWVLAGRNRGPVRRPD